MKVTISLPEDVLAAAEKARQLRGQSRSAFFRQAVEDWLSKLAERDPVVRYLDAYRRQPETSEEIEMADHAAAVLAQEP